MAKPDLKEQYFPFLQVSDGLKALRGASKFKGHIVLNPPFSSAAAAPECDWATGATSQAATFFLAASEALSPNSKITAILPDVLRSGSRYKAWRARVSHLLEIDHIAIYGQFDNYADVDVFVIDATKPSERQISLQDVTAWWPELGGGLRVSEIFDVRVGPVVDNRDPREGREVPFLVARDLPLSGIAGTPRRVRRFAGRLVDPPFVAVRRTSRPRAKDTNDGVVRVSGVVIGGSQAVAVDNHLITLSPREGGEVTCLNLLDTLESEEVNAWLDQRIRCRHLTVGIVQSIPWRRPAQTNAIDQVDSQD